MSLFDEILETITLDYGPATVQVHGIYRTASKKVSTDEIEPLLGKIKTILASWTNTGETLILHGTNGTINDSGQIQFDITEGYMIEYYHYETMTVLFIRLYNVTDRQSLKSWGALYLDENPSTPWWPEEERANA